MTTSSIYIWYWEIINESDLTPLAIHCFFRLAATQLPGSLISHQDKVMGDQRRPCLHTVLFSLILIVYLSDFDNERLFYTKHCVGRLVGIILQIQRAVTVSIMFKPCF